MSETVEIAELRQKAEAALELEKRQRDSKLLFYRPCCRTHKFSCPIWTCGDSKHLKFHKSDARIRVVFGGNRSGKTLMGILEILLMACFKEHPFRKTKNPVNGRYRIYGSDFSVVEKLYLPIVREWIPKECLYVSGKTKEEAFHDSFDSKYHILRLKNATIDFMSYDQDTAKSASVEMDGIAADEEMPEDIYAEAVARVVSRNGKLWMTVTPLYKMGWAMRFLDEVNPQIEIFNFEIWDNPHLSEDAIKDFMAAMPEHEREARIHGRFLELQGLVYKELRNDVHYIQPDIKPQPFPVVFCIDPHPRKPSACVWAYVTPKDDVVFFDELEVSGSARDIAHAIRAKESTHVGKTMLRLIDPAAKAQASSLGYETDTLREFEREGMGFTIADNSEAGYNVVHEYLTFNPALPIGAFNRPKCFFTREVSRTWSSMTHLMWDEWAFRNALRDKKETIKDHKKDFADTVRYVLASRPTYRSFSNVRSVPIGNYVPHMNRTSEVRGMVLGKI